MNFLDMLYHVPFAFPTITANTVTSRLCALIWRDVVTLDMRFEILIVLETVHAHSIAI